MPTIKLERVVSCSSEDPNHPAVNLLKSDSTKAWKCKNPGEQQVSAVLQFKEPTLINGIDIGNELSAFVEVFGGRSTTDEYQVLLVTSSFMTPIEGRQASNGNRVRMFSKAQLSKPAVEEKWDRVKIVCTQPFNKNIQYGLSFITFHAPEKTTDNDSQVTSLGRFKVRDEAPDDIVQGHLFRQSKIENQPLTPRASGAVAIREASSPGNVEKLFSKVDEEKVEKKETVTRVNTNTPSHSVKNGESSTSKNIRDPGSTKVIKENKAMSSDEESSNKIKKDIVSPKNNSTNKTDSQKKNKVATPGKRANDDSSSKVSKMLKAHNTRQKKPFNKLMEDVVFVISGYQNPFRADLRSQALQMGAKYRPDWDNSCTHLICAYPNTPKFQQVQGKGKIVRKTWIEDCFNKRKRLPWRRYALDRNDQGKDESEDEISEDNPGVRRNILSLDEESDIDLDASDDDKDYVPTKEQTTLEVNESENTFDDYDNHGPLQGSDTDDEIEKFKQKIIDPYDADTDVDEEEPPDTSHLPLPPLLNIFEDMKFYLDPSLLAETRRQLNRYIIAFKGIVTSILQDTQYFITDKVGNAKSAKLQLPSVTCVAPAWIWDSNDAEKLLPVDDYILK